MWCHVKPSWNDCHKNRWEHKRSWCHDGGKKWGDHCEDKWESHCDKPKCW